MHHATLKREAPKCLGGIGKSYNYDCSTNCPLTALCVVIALHQMTTAK